MSNPIKCDDCGKPARRFYFYNGDPLPNSHPNYPWTPLAAKCKQHRITHGLRWWLTISKNEYVVGKMMES